MAKESDRTVLGDAMNANEIVVAMLIRGVVGAVVGVFAGLYYSGHGRFGRNDDVYGLSLVLFIVGGAVLGALTALSDARQLNSGKFPGGPVE